MASSIGRIRTIKPEFFGSPDTVAAHPIVRLAYIGLWCFADDHGRGEYDEDVLKGFLFPRQNIAALSDGAFTSIGDVLAGVVDAYGVVLYTVRGRSYFDVPSFGRHQRAYRGRESKFPGPDEADTELPGTSGNFRELPGDSGSRETGAEGARSEAHGSYVSKPIGSPVDNPPNGVLTTANTGFPGTSGNFRELPGTSRLEQWNSGTGEQWNRGGRANDHHAIKPVENPGAPTVATRADAARPKRGTRLPDNWAPNLHLPANQQLHAQHSHEWLSDQLEIFRDYWTAKTGQQATKVDWDATWRNWLRRSAGQEKPRQTPEAARIQAMYADAATRQVSIFQQIIDADTRRAS